VPIRSRISQPECIDQYEASARARINTGVTLLSGGDSLGVELIGLAAEMLLKAAYYRLIGYAPLQPLGRDDLTGAKSDAIVLSVIEPHDAYHNLLFWTELIIATHDRGFPVRTRPAGLPAPPVSPNAMSPVDVSLLRRAVARLVDNWSISDRYLAVQPYATRQDLEDVFEDVMVIVDLYDAARM